MYIFTTRVAVYTQSRDTFFYYILMPKNSLELGFERVRTREEILSRRRISNVLDEKCRSTVLVISRLIGVTSNPPILVPEIYLHGG